jgi:CheY-like chemotaxis protein
MSLLLDELLSVEGYQVCLWPSQEGAAEFIRDRRPDLVILDLWLQRGDDGTHLLERLGSDELTRRVPMLLCTGDPEALPRAALRRLDQYEILAKPFLLDEFVEQLCAMVDLLTSRSTGTSARHTVGPGSAPQPA